MVTILALVLQLAALQVQPASGRGSVSGIAVPAETTEPLPGVAIVVTPQDDTATKAAADARTGRTSVAISDPLRTSTNKNGEFTLNVPPGTYSISADRDGLAHQDRFRTEKGSPLQSIITVVAGQKVSGLILTLSPAPAISGRVSTAENESLAAATVHAYRVRYTPYGRKLVYGNAVLSHERGEYRLFHLIPGNYIVSASYSNRSIQPWESVLHLTPNMPRPSDGYSTTYFPATLELRDAKLMNLTTAREISGIDLVFRDTAYFKLTIRLDSPRPPAPPLINSRIALLPLGADLGAALDYQVRGRDGAFAVDRLAAGDYVLVALADFANPMGEIQTRIVSDTLPIRVDENKSVMLPTTVPLDIPGRVNLEGGTNSPSDRQQVRLERVDSYVTQTTVTDIDAMGRFSLFDVGPGLYDVFVDGKPRTAFVRDAGLVGSVHEVGRLRIEFNQAKFLDAASTRWRTTAEMAIILNSRGASFSGSVVAFGKASPGAQVVLVPLDQQARLREDRYFTTYAEAKGAFQIRGIPPGTYSAYAFENIEPEIYFDAEFNSQISSVGKTVTLMQDAKESLELKLITAEDIARLVR